MNAIAIGPHNRDQILAGIGENTWIVACLCAAWCDVCKSYLPQFDALAERHPDKCFLWIDVEDEADLVGDIDIENFPTLLLQRGELVAFFGSVLPEIGVAARLVTSYAEQSPDMLAAGIAKSAQHQAWQRDCNLVQRLRAL